MSPLSKRNGGSAITNELQPMSSNNKSYRTVSKNILKEGGLKSNKKASVVSDPQQKSMSKLTDNEEYGEAE